MRLPRIGKMRHVLKILTRTETPSGDADTSEVFQEVDTVRGELIPLSGLQKIDTKQIGQGVTHKLTIRYRDDVTDRHWLEHDGRRFKIQNFRNLGERDRFLELMLEEQEVVP